MELTHRSDKLTAQEKFYFYNTLAVLIKAVVGNKTTIDLRNESTIYGKVLHADAYMNITMKNCFFTDPRGDTYKYDMFFIHTRNIRSVHIPPQIRIIPAIKKELHIISNGKKDIKSKQPRTFKNKRALQKLKTEKEMAKKLLEEKNQNAPSTSQKK